MFEYHCVTEIEPGVTEEGGGLPLPCPAIGRHRGEGG